MTVLLIFFNILEVLLVAAGIFGVPFREMVFGDRAPTGKAEHAILVIRFLMVLAVINYGLVYHRNKHHEYFFRLSYEGQYVRPRYFYVFWLYFLLTVLQLGWWLVQSIANMK